MTITLTREEAQQVLDVLNDVRYRIEFGQMNLCDDTDAAIETLRTRLAQPESEPVAWLFQHEETGLTDCIDTQQVEWGFEKNNPRWQKIAPLYTAPPQRVYCSCGDGIVPDDGALCGTCVSLKKMREWQGLTDEEKQTAYAMFSTMSAIGFVQAIEAKLKEKNS
jgi:hypothetical protein